MSRHVPFTFHVLENASWQRCCRAGYLPRPSHSGMFRRSPASRRRAWFSAQSLPLLRLSPLQPRNEGERGLGQVRREGTGPQVGAGLYSGAWGGWDSPRAGPQPYRGLKTDGTPTPEWDPNPTAESQPHRGLRTDRTPTPQWDPSLAEGSQPHRGPPTLQGAQD